MGKWNWDVLSHIYEKIYGLIGVLGILDKHDHRVSGSSGTITINIAGSDSLFGAKIFFGSLGSPCSSNINGIWQQ